MTTADPDPPAARRGFGRRAMLIGANVLLYFFLVRWAINNINFHLLLEALGRVPPTAIAITVLGNFVALLLYGLRMSRLLKQGFMVALMVVVLGFALNIVLPFRLGDVTKIYLGRRLFGIRISQLVSATFAEKLIDLASLLMLGGIVVSFSGSRFVNIDILVPLMLLVCGVICGVLAFRLLLPRFIRLVPKRSGMRRGVVALHRQLGSYRSVTVYLVTLGIWCLSIGLSYYAFNTYIPGVHVNVFDAIAILVITALVIAVPSAPAGLGLYEAGIVAYLQQKLGVGPEAALAAASVFHLAMTLPQAALAVSLFPLLSKRAKA